MKLHTLKPAAGAVQTRKRIGRGPGSGLGGTSTRGHKGAKARSGYKAINLSTLQELAAAKNLEKIGVEELIAAGFINSRQLVKILGNGELTTKLDVTAHAFSKTAEAAITALGGTATKLYLEN